MNKTLFFVLFIISVFIIGFTLFELENTGEVVDQKMQDIGEYLRPANLNITEITYYPCTKCNATTSFAKYLTEFNKVDSYQITEWEPGVINEDTMLSIRARKYNISRIPALIVTGEIEKAGLAKYKVEDAAILEANDAPFMDITTGKFIGDIIVATVYDPGCKQCRNESVWLEELEDAGVWISSRMRVDNTSIKGRHYIEEYNITIFPTAILSEELENYSFIFYTWQKVGTKEGNVYITKKEIPPYYDSVKNKVTGLTTIYFINDSTCLDCYDLMIHKSLLEPFNIYFNKEVYLDLPEAKGLMEKYNITKVPTIILSNETLDYGELAVSWHQVGTIEEDGSMVFRNLEGLGGKYKTLGVK